jgi:hypothetical protein
MYAQQRSGGPKAEVKPEGGSSSEESKEKLAELMRVFVELSSQSGSHLQCIIGAGTALGTMVHLLHAMDVGTSSISRSFHSSCAFSPPLGFPPLESLGIPPFLFHANCFRCTSALAALTRSSLATSAERSKVQSDYEMAAKPSIGNYSTDSAPRLPPFPPPS